jgi:hypothetical protein
MMRMHLPLLEWFPMIGSQTGARQLLASSLLLVACSSSSLGVGSKKDTGQPPTDMASADKRDGSLAISPDSLPTLTSNDAAPDFVVPVIPVAKDAATDLGPLCQETTSLSYDSGISQFPLDWQLAQSPLAWCGMYKDSPPTGLCLSQTSDGYNEAILAYFEGGEMMIVAELFFLYDPRTGKLVAQLFAVTPTQPLTCEFRTPDGPPNPDVDPRACLGGTPLQPVCAPAGDAGP